MAGRSGRIGSVLLALPVVAVTFQNALKSVLELLKNSWWVERGTPKAVESRHVRYVASGVDPKPNYEAPRWLA